VGLRKLLKTSNSFYCVNLEGDRDPEGGGAWARKVGVFLAQSRHFCFIKLWVNQWKRGGSDTYPGEDDKLGALRDIQCQFQREGEKSCRHKAVWGN